MRLISLELENFECHSNSVIDFTLFSSALIMGKEKNDDRISNGVGKSSIFRAIDYVLFRQAAVNLDKLIRDDTDRCKVTFVFGMADGEYKVVRTRSNKNKSGESDLELYNKVDDQWKKITKRSNSDTELELASIIKIGYKAFRYSVLFSQKDVGLAHVSPDKRKQMLKEPLQLIVYGKLEKIAKTKLSDTTKEYDKITSIIEMLGEPEKDIEAASAELSVSNSKLKDGKESLELASVDIQSDRDSLTELQKLVSSGAASVNEKYNAVKSKKANVIKLISKTDKEISALNDELLASTDDLNQKTVAFDKLKTKLELLKESDTFDISIAEDELKALQAEESGLISKKGAGEAKHKELLNFFLPESGTKCTSCKQMVGQEHIDLCLKETNDHIERVKTALDKIKTRLSNIKTDKELKSNKITSSKAIKNDIKSLQEKIANCSDILKSKKSNILRIDGAIKDKSGDLKEISSGLIELDKEILELEEIIQNLSKNDLDKEVILLTNKIKEKEKEIGALNNTISLVSSRIGSLTERISAKKKDEIKIKENTVYKKSLDSKIKIQESVAKAYSSSGIPTVIIYTILNDLQIESNNLLSELRPGMELLFEIDKPNDDGEVQDTLDISYKVNGRDREWGQLSGGQQFYVDIALKLGLAKVIQSRLGINIEFLELDEVDASLDKAGVDALADVIKKWQNKFKILVITHNDTLKSKFRHNILVENDGINGAMAKVIDCGDQ